MIKMNRRTALKLAGLGAIGAAGFYGGYRLLPPGPSATLESVDALAQRLYLSLDARQRADACVSYDHPLRQYHNRGVWGGGRSALLFTRAQRRMLTDLMYSGLSTEGRQRIPKEYFTRLPGVHSMRVLISGDPTAGPYQVILTGAHVNLRVGGKSREGAAFGGPQIYGDQRGDGRAGLPGNLYREQFLLAQQLLHSLDEGRKKQALVEEAPVQTGIELQGRHGSFAGIPVAELTPESKGVARVLVDKILSTYPPADVAYARDCLAANGGNDGLYLSYYQHGEDGDIPEAQVFRLEGPGAVFYFRGHPHVHAFINVAMDGDAPLSVGESLGNNPAWLDRKGVKNLFETAMCVETTSDLAYYPEGSVAGRLRRGLIRSGDIYSLESWQETTEVVEIRGSSLGTALLEGLREHGATPDPAKVYKVATTPYAASELKEELGSVESRQSGALIRDITVSYLRTHGFPA